MICWAIESYRLLLKVESVIDMHVVGDLGPWGRPTPPDPLPYSFLSNKEK